MKFPASFTLAGMFLSCAIGSHRKTVFVFQLILLMVVDGVTFTLGICQTCTKNDKPHAQSSIYASYEEDGG